MRPFVSIALCLLLIVGASQSLLAETVKVHLFVSGMT